MKPIRFPKTTREAELSLESQKRAAILFKEIVKWAVAELRWPTVQSIVEREILAAKGWEQKPKKVQEAATQEETTP